MIDLTDLRIQVVLETVRRAARLMRNIQRETVVSSLTKGDKSPVTIADFASQALIARILGSSFPEIPLVAEETATALRAPEGADLLAQVAKYVKTVLPEATPESVCDWIDRGGAEPGRQFFGECGDCPVRCERKKATKRLAIVR